MVLYLCGFVYGETVTVTWEQPTTTNLKDFDLRVNETDIINIPGQETREWTGDVVLVDGTNVFDMRARNLANDVSIWSIPAYYDYNNGMVIVDNGDANTSFTGSWLFSGGANSYGNVSVYSKEIATYSFDTALHGTFEVSLWWTEWSSRSTAVFVKIYDGDVLLDTVTVNQMVNGGQWNMLGVYTFCANTAKVTILSGGGGFSTCADAVKYVYIPISVPINVTISQ